MIKFISVWESHQKLKQLLLEQEEDLKKGEMVFIQAIEDRLKNIPICYFGYPTFLKDVCADHYLLLLFLFATILFIFSSSSD